MPAPSFWVATQSSILSLSMVATTASSIGVRIEQGPRPCALWNIVFAQALLSTLALFVIALNPYSLQLAWTNFLNILAALLLYEYLRWPWRKNNLLNVPSGGLSFALTGTLFYVAIPSASSTDFGLDLALIGSLLASVVLLPILWRFRRDGDLTDRSRIASGPVISPAGLLVFLAYPFIFWLVLFSPLRDLLSNPPSRAAPWTTQLAAAQASINSQGINAVFDHIIASPIYYPTANFSTTLSVSFDYSYIEGTAIRERGWVSLRDVDPQLTKRVEHLSGEWFYNLKQEEIQRLIAGLASVKISPREAVEAVAQEATDYGRQHGTAFRPFSVALQIPGTRESYESPYDAPVSWAVTLLSDRPINQVIYSVDARTGVIVARDYSDFEPGPAPR
jgi:hypothetical protein